MEQEQKVSFKDKLKTTKLQLKINDEIELRLGMRTFKTGLSVMLSVLICELLGRDTPAIAALSSVFTLRQDSTETWKFTKIRIFSNIIGAIIAVLFVFLYKLFPSHFWANLVLLPLGVIIIIIFCDAINQNMAIIGASSTFLVLLITNSELLSINLVLLRVVDTFIGSLVSIIINVLIKPQKKSN